MTAMTGDKEYDASSALRHQQRWLVVKSQQSQQWLQLLGGQRSCRQAWTGIGGRGSGD